MNESAGGGLVDCIFVYGTLKRGQCRSSLWPRSPIEVRAAWIYGKLYSRDDYPAMKAGGDRVIGETWRFAAVDIQPTLDVLDQIEGFNQGLGKNLYERQVVETYCGGVEAMTCRSAGPEADSHQGPDSDSNHCNNPDSEVLLGNDHAYAYFYSGDPTEDGFVRLNSPASWPT